MKVLGFSGSPRIEFKKDLEQQEDIIKQAIAIGSNLGGN